MDRGELDREAHEVRLPTDALETTRAVLSDDSAQHPLICLQRIGPSDHPIIQAVDEQLLYGGLIIA
jgi:hypothetical protein